MLIAVARLARRLGDTNTVWSVLGEVEDIFERYAWRPLEDHVAVRELLQAAPRGTGAVVNVVEFLERVTRPAPPSQ